MAAGKEWAYNADSRNWCSEHQFPPRTYLWGLRFHRNRTVIRPNNGWTAFISSWIIE